MSTTAEVLVSLGDRQYIVKRDSRIPAGEIHIGSFAALDALIEVASKKQPAPTMASQPQLFDGATRNNKMVRMRLEECTAIRSWLSQHGGTLNELERKIMAGSFPPSTDTYVPSAAVAVAVGVGPEVVRRVRNDVMRRAGIIKGR